MDAAVAKDRLVGKETNRHEDVDRCGREVEASCGNADNRRVLAIDVNRRADFVAPAAKAPLPERVAQDSHWLGRGQVIRGGERPAVGDGNPQYAEELGRDVGLSDAHRVSATAQARLRRGQSGEAL